MTHESSQRFWHRYYSLPSEIQILADKNFELLKINPKHPSLHFKKIKNYWSVRVGLSYRALGIEIQNKNTIVWFWIGHHREYDKLIS